MATVGIDFLLNTSGDLDFSSGGFELVESVDAIVQEVRMRFYAVQGDWFLNLNEGLPLFSRILIDSPNESDLYSIYKAEFGKIPGVLLKDKDLSVDKEGTDLFVNGTLQTTEGPVTFALSI